jgi:hypothetical protein
MKNKLILLIAVVLLAASAFGQTATTSTTLSAAVSDSSGQQIVVASATNINAPSSSHSGSKLYVDREVMDVTAVNGTTITVVRGATGTRATPHVSGATVYVGYAATQGNPDALKQYVPVFGACTASNEVYLPRVYINSAYAGSGNIADCFGGSWQFDLNMPLYKISVAPGAQRSAASPSAGNANSIVAQAGGASSNASNAGGAGGAATYNAGAGGAGASTGTAGAGGALSLAAGAGGAAAGAAAVGGAGGAVAIAGGASGGSVTSGAGGAVSISGGASANGSTAAGNGGNVTLKGGNVGSGGTGAVGKVQVAGAVDATKLIVFDPSGNTTAIASTLASADTSAHTHTLVDATGTLSQAVAKPCAAASASCTETLTNNVKTIYGISGALNGASPSVAAVTFSTGFTSSSSYVCTANPNGNTAAVAAGGIAITYTSATVVTFVSANAASAAVSFICQGT